MSNQRNAIILAAGMSSRFVPLSAEYPKGLLEVKGEILIERQICQLHEAGINNITVIVGYKSWMFDYLRDKYGVEIIMNEDFYRYNNTSSLIRVLDKLHDTYICSSDNYFPKNVFMEAPSQSYYSALYAKGKTDEYCLVADEDGNITHVTIGGHDSWYMVGHVYFNEEFSQRFRQLLAVEYEKEEVKLGYWEDVYISHLADLPKMKIHQYGEHAIEEFDSIDDLRDFDVSYVENTRSSIIKGISARLRCPESCLSGFIPLRHTGDYLFFTFRKDGIAYKYNEKENSIEQL